MAKAGSEKFGLTKFGWLALIGVGAAVLGSKERRGKLAEAAKGFTDRFGGPSRGASNGGAQPGGTASVA